MTDAERTCEAAIAYADLGFLVLPLWWVRDGRCGCGKPDCSSPGKHPWGRFAPNGLKDAAKDVDVIRSWFANGQTPNIRIRTGEESGILVIDIDPRHGGDKSLVALGTLPRTATAGTGGGGQHLCFEMPAADIRSFSADKTPVLGPGIDVRANGGYIVAPPSRHVSGGEYKWLIDPRAGFAELPQHVLAKLIERAAPVKVRAPINGTIPKGQRDNTLTSMAGTMRRRGMTEGAILAALREENHRCEEPLSDGDLQRIARSIGKKEPGEFTSRPKREPPHLVRAVPFPVASLPQPVADFVDSAARAIGCDQSFVALPLLAGLASAIGNTRRVQLKRGWTEPAILWAAIVADSGTLKSPALELALRPIRKRQHFAMRQYAEESRQFQDELLLWEKKMATWKRSKDGDDPPAKPVEPKVDRCWCDDTTMEALAVLLLQNWRGLLLVRDELSGWLGSFDRYSQGKGADAAKWLEMFGGRSMMVDRKSGLSKTIYVPRAAVSVVGSIQPEILRRALGVEHRENGLAARLLLACPPRRPKHWTEADIAPDMEDCMEAIFDKLYGLEPMMDEEGEAQPVNVPLSPDGKATWVAFYNEHGQEQAELVGDLAATWSKLEGYAGRLALVIHFVRWAGGDPSLATVDEIDAKSIEAGVTLSRWFGIEARRVYAILGESDEQRDQRRLVEVIQRKGGSVTVRDLMRATRTFSNAEAAERALDELGKAGYGHWEDPPIGPTGGRPTRRFVLDPGVDADRTLDSGPFSGVVSASTVSTGTDCSDEREERAAILEYDGELPRKVAEERAFGSEEGA